MNGKVKKNKMTQNISYSDKNSFPWEKIKKSGYVIAGFGLCECASVSPGLMPFFGQFIGQINLNAPLTGHKRASRLVDI